MHALTIEYLVVQYEPRYKLFRTILRAYFWQCLPRISILLLWSDGHQRTEWILCRVVESFCLPTRKIVPHISWHDLPYHKDHEEILRFSEHGNFSVTPAVLGQQIFLKITKNEHCSRKCFPVRYFGLFRKTCSDSIHCGTETLPQISLKLRDLEKNLSSNFLVLSDKLVFISCPKLHRSPCEHWPFFFPAGDRYLILLQRNVSPFDSWPLFLFQFSRAWRQSFVIEVSDLDSSSPLSSIFVNWASITSDESPCRTMPIQL